METYFGIRYEFDRELVQERIAQFVANSQVEYICVTDGVIVDNVNRNEDYRKVVNGSAFSICDSSYVPLYIKWIYGRQYQQYCGSQIFKDIVSMRKYRMYFMGTSQEILDGLKRNISEWNPDVAGMNFYELPFCSVDEFDYPAIAKRIDDSGADIIWIALGAPKQEIFMSRLKPYLKHGVMIAVGAAFKFYSGIEARRAPTWMVRMHMEFIYRIICEPRKQLRRCWGIINSLPRLLFKEWERSKHK